VNKAQSAKHVCSCSDDYLQAFVHGCLLRNRAIPQEFESVDARRRLSLGSIPRTPTTTSNDRDLWRRSFDW
jgi:hypothetical protein